MDIHNSDFPEISGAVRKNSVILIKRKVPPIPGRSGTGPGPRKKTCLAAEDRQQLYTPATGKIQDEVAMAAISTTFHANVR